ncbi:MAG TPA: flagellar biosynthesis protein FlhB [Candidatus Latescibacteria bacterium]|nr:flagellar biosynthesis protein FlhB [Candidatus Latescibacterota bacterium]
MPEETERTEQATPRRRQEARRRGSVAKSMEVNSALALLGGTLVLYVWGGHMLRGMADVVQGVLAGTGTARLTPVEVQRYASAGLVFLGTLLGPFLAAMVVFGLAANYAQVGVLFSGEPLVPRWDRINPAAGFKRMFSKRALFELLKGVFKIVLVGWVAYGVLRGRMEKFFEMADWDVGEVFGFIASTAFMVLVKSGLVLLILALLDYGFQRWEYERTLKMTRQELKEEFRQTEGDPLVRARIRSLQRQLARQRMMQAVSKADVVVINPTLLAVALMYIPEKMEAPQVVAKGARKLAERIREIAMEYKVPIVEDPPLARLLYRRVEVGQQIPMELYQAVARILAYIFQLRGEV